MSRLRRQRRPHATSTSPDWEWLTVVAAPLVHKHGSPAVVAMLTDAARRLHAASPSQRAAEQARLDRGPLGPLLRAARTVPAQALRSSLIPVAVGIGAAAVVGVAEADELAGPTGLSDVQLMQRSLEIPIREHRLGPMSRARQRRALSVLAAMELAGLSQVLAGGPARRAAGLGLMVPGAGFLYTADPALFAVSAAAAATGLVAWIGTGNHLITPIAWLGAAAWAATRATDAQRNLAAAFLVPLLVAGAAEGTRRKYKRDYHLQLEAARQTNMLLSTVTPPLRGDDRPEVHVGTELNDHELALTRHLVDISLQDPKDWEHFEILEQFQPSAVRYQINQLGWALAQQQYARTPAFRGYLSEAQRRLIERYQERQVWSYWFLENMWGNFELNPDPVRKQNVMLSGFFGLQLAVYESATGDSRYGEPGSITFRWSKDKAFEYSFRTICEAMVRDLTKSPWGMIVCEPNWIYAYCNTTAGNSFRVHDRLYGTDFWERVRPGFARGMEEEMTRVDGLMHNFKSTRVGLAEGKAPGPSVVLRPLLPHLADRSWALLQAGGWVPDEHGTLHTVLREGSPGIDFGNYSRNPLMGYAAFLDAARETGDEERFQVAWDELLETQPHTYENGRLRFDASLFANAMVGKAIFSRKSGWLDLITRGLPQAWKTGPTLEDVPYDRVLVARAVTDGIGLEFVLRGHSHEPISAKLAGLAPGRTYAVTGAIDPMIKGGRDGTASLRVHVDDRAEVRLAPAEDE